MRSSCFTTLAGVLIENSETFNEYNGTYEQINDDIYLVDTNTTLYGGVLEVRLYIVQVHDQFHKLKKNAIKIDLQTNEMQVHV